MNLSEDIKRVILLVITTVLFLLFLTGMAVPSDTNVETTIINV